MSGRAPRVCWTCDYASVIGGRFLCRSSLISAQNWRTSAFVRSVPIPSFEVGDCPVHFDGPGPPASDVWDAGLIRHDPRRMTRNWLASLRKSIEVGVEVLDAALMLGREPEEP